MFLGNLYVKAYSLNSGMTALVMMGNNSQFANRELRIIRIFVL